MIKHHEEIQITSVTFGKEGKGTVSVGVAGNFLVLKGLARPMNISDQCQKEDLKPLPKVELEFFDPASIDVMIEILKKVKSNIQYPHGTLCLAC